MTEHATRLVGPATFWSLTSNPVVTDLFEPPKQHEMEHISLSESADLLLIVPATANIIGKLANGLADDALSTIALAVKCPVVVAPAMNVNMYTNPIVVANVDRLRQHDWIIVEPEEGHLACGDQGIGRLSEPDRILSVVEEAITGVARDLAMKKVLVSAGPTQEPIDPVRYITNRSSGKMGYAIAEAAAARGAQVTLISGPTNLRPPEDVVRVGVSTVREMFDAVTEHVADADIFISAAAPADFTPSHVQTQKVKKSEHWTMEMDKARDILEAVGAAKGNTILVGFAAETEDMEENAAEKLAKKNLDLIVANNVSTGSDVFGGDTNQVTLISKTGDKVEWPRMSKREVANLILDYVKKNFLEDIS
jgi:phosphopantothenoylcysteine decarboxylase/phosphopantothenate--cysteine ligase